MTIKILSETEQVNSARLDLFSGPTATRLVATIAEQLRADKRRLVAIGAGAGRSFVIATGGIATVQAPADFAEAVAEVDSKPVQTWPVAVHDEIDNEQVGAEIAAQPWLY